VDVPREHAICKQAKARQVWKAWPLCQTGKHWNVNIPARNAQLLVDATLQLFRR
jgi:hypothetical protein